MILDDESDDTGAEDKAEDVSGDVDAEHIGWDTSPYNTLATSELASEPTESIDTSSPWFDVEDSCYFKEPAARLRSSEQQGVTAPVQDPLQTLPQSS